MVRFPDGARPGGSPALPHLQLVAEGERVAGPPPRCRCCGGSGVLRTDAAGFRTCLDCLGQGGLASGALSRLQVVRVAEPPLPFRPRSPQPPSPLAFSASRSSGAR